MGVESVNVAYQVIVCGDAEAKHGPPLDREEDAVAVVNALRGGYQRRFERRYNVLGVSLTDYVATMDAGSRIELFKGGVIGEGDL